MKKYLYLNLKRFDVLREFGGVNGDLDLKNWSVNIIKKITEPLKEIKAKSDVEIVMYLPELHLFNALEAADETISVGCQGIFYENVSKGGNFGAFTTHRVAAAMKQIGVKDVIIGHFEERKDKNNLLSMAGTEDKALVNRILNKELALAIEAGIAPLYCIGESLEERQISWKEVLKLQIEEGLKGIDLAKVKIAYEPLWAIGPGKTPATAEEIKEVVDFIKSIVDVPVLYGGGLKSDNAASISKIEGVDGGLIALTRFTGDIGFYPEEYLEIIKTYLG
jgi:triose-phosphate isomerase